VIFNDRSADFAEKYLKKGAKVYVEGALQTRKWTDQAGVEKFTTEVVIGRFNGVLTSLSGGGSEGGYSGGMSEPGMSQPAARAPARAPAGGRPAAAPSWDAPRGGDLDDEIPF